jgi:site-specific DNA recombinase
MVKDARVFRGQRRLYSTVEKVEVEEEFKKVANKDGILGDPEGIPAYCYIRVSSEAQTEDGRSGLPRQLQHIDEKAKEENLAISWNMVFTDAGYSGFQFENRPELSRLRQEVATNPRSKYLMMEHLDRLSRNVKWHQGFLLDEFEGHGMKLVFWRAYSSEIERTVLGTIAEEGMRTEIARMREGMVYKAKSGRITAKRPAYGYIFVDSDGNPGPQTSQDTHYAHHPEASKIMRFVYEQLIYHDSTLGPIAEYLNRNEIPTPHNATAWTVASLARMVKSPVYKGEFYANRFYQELTGEHREDGKPKRVTRERPTEEWIKIEVPAIVTPEEWQLAQEVLKSNQKRSTRNMKKREWLLSSFVRCDICGYAYNATIGGGKNKSIRYYGCKGRNSARARATGQYCRSPYVHADLLEQLVWDNIAELVFNPEIIIEYLEREHEQEWRREYETQLEFLGKELEKLASQKVRWREAYLNEVITLEEYKSHRQQIEKRAGALRQEQQDLETKLGTEISLEEKKRIVLKGLEGIREQMAERELSFEFRRRILGLLIDQIYVDSEKKTIRLEGVIRETYSFESGLILRWR